MNNNEFQFPELPVSFNDDIKTKVKISHDKTIRNDVLMTALIAMIYRYTKEKDIVIICDKINNAQELSLMKISVEKQMTLNDILSEISSSSKNNSVNISKKKIKEFMKNKESYFLGFFQKGILEPDNRYFYITNEENEVPYLHCNFIKKEFANQMSTHISKLSNINVFPKIPIDEINFLTDEEQIEIFQDFNNTFENYEKNCVHSIFEKHALTTPHLVAAKFKEETITYKELNEKSNQLARVLKKNGVGIGDLIAISIDRSLEMIIGLLSILKVGAAYVPIDPNLPDAKIDYILEDSSASIILINKAFNNFSNIKKLRIDEPNIYSNESTSNINLQISIENLMYVIYTSGSTGNPKGVMVQHGAVTNRLIWMREKYKLKSEDIILQKTPFSFDVSVWELFLPIICGAKIVFAKPEGHKDSQYLINTINSEKVTTVHFVPSMLNAFLENEDVGTCLSLKRVFCSGEELTKYQQKKFHQMLKSELYNLYGPTEAAIDVTHWTCHVEDNYNYVPIGNPISNMQTLILNSELTPEPKGVTGELYLAGVGLAKGYLNKKELTSKSFIDNPFSALSTQKIYKTGDLARLTLDNHIEYIGRNDTQVKIRGHRIELTEIEIALRKVPGIQDAIVIARESKSGKKLVAHILKTKESHFNLKYIRAELSKVLAVYMIPSFFYVLDEWPKTHNGKLDRMKLLNSKTDLTENSVEEIYESGKKSNKNDLLCNIWSEVLDVPQINIDDDFFELGGDSILALLIVAKARKEGIQLDLNDLLDKRTIKSIDKSRKTISIDTDQNQIIGEISKTPIQNWFFNKNLNNQSHWNMSIVLDTPDNINIQLLEESLQRIIHYHDNLRTRFYKVENEFKAKIDENIDLSFEVKDFSGLSPNDQNKKIQKDLNENQSSLNLEENLLKVLFLKLSPVQSNKLVLIFHHLIMDGVSWRIFIEDLTQIYSQLNNNQEVVLPKKTTSYKMWAEKQKVLVNSPLMDIDKYFWYEKFVSYEMNIPLTVDKGPQKRKEIIVKLNSDFTSKLLKDSLKGGEFKINEVLLTPLYLSLNRWNNDKSFLIDLEGHGRENIDGTVDLSRTIGWFTSIFPVSFIVNNLENKSNIDLLTLISNNLNEIPHKGVGFGMLRDFSEESRRLLLIAKNKPKIKFNYLGQFNNGKLDSIFKINNSLSMNDVCVTENSDYILDIVARVINGCMEICFEYYEHNLDRNTVDSIANNYLIELKNLLCDLSQKHDMDNLNDSNLKEEDLNKIYSLYR